MTSPSTFRIEAPSAEAVIEVREVGLSFEDFRVLDGVSFVVKEGETKIILGESGSGKTVLIKLIAGLIRPDEGQIFVNHQEITALSEDRLMPIRKNIGIVFQETALFDSLTVLENVAYRLHEEGGHDEVEIEQQVREVLGFVGLEDAIHLMPSDLSGGMRRRVALARALITKPRIILYDEPTAGLDPLTGRTIVEMILKLRYREGVTSVFVTHRLTDAFTLASERVVVAGGEIGFDTVDLKSPQSPDLRTSFIVLKDGRIVFEGNERELLQAKQTDPFIRQFLS
ncbi:MAG: ATP-binding cassette domain-containing protein [Acidobacteriia bacterium]|nr:ATP-binding cassette domain-containing protein [Terriglobia bacterium]